MVFTFAYFSAFSNSLHKYCLQNNKWCLKKACSEPGAAEWEQPCRSLQRARSPVGWRPAVYCEAIRRLPAPFPLAEAHEAGVVI